ncbi:hypothetical protein BDW02DRAFT_632579 [Decorospora gaudefroyi]|uniref:Uncharacterized protein n=1 Tax=Decorospora gaudefroyi TaxID=184978 RepID=A0A6A5K4V1_9PLEO|nr:hypothetical protein BDW02DRAFT_632579 [Decorospora gaudefroyi]
MKLLLATLSLVALAAANPSPAQHINVREDAPTGPSIGDTKDCDPGQTYCLVQVIYEMGVPEQTILHSYCEEQYKIDAISCHACTKFPFPMENCTAEYPAWNSAFTCLGDQEYTFAHRCKNWCDPGGNGGAPLT